MPVKVPSYDNFQTRVAGGGTPGFSDPGFARNASIAGEQDQKLGQAIEGAASQGVKIAVDVQDEANQLRVTDAMNQARERAMKLTYDPQEGYQNLKGNSALSRPDGLALPEEYAGKLNKDVGDIAASLSNDAQRRAFAMRSQDFVTGFKTDVQQHMLTEFRNYHNSVADGDLKLSAQDAELNWNNPAKIDNAINGTPDPLDPTKRYGGVKQSVYQKARLNGMSATEAQAVMNDAESNIHATVIQSALLNGNVTYANAYLDKNKGNMTADDILKVQGQVTQKMDAHMAVVASTEAAKDYQGSFNPSDLDRLTGVVLSNESAGRRFADDGTILTSPKGAKGEMQVMDGTATDPGFGVEPAKDNTPEELARVGRDYIAAMVKRYADPAKALAAYNAGPGTVDKAIEAATKAGNPNDWLNHMADVQSPASNKETLDYVEKGMKKFGAGAGAPPLPTESDFINAAVAKLGDNPRLEAMEATRTQAAAQYKLLKDARTQRGDAALDQAQKELIANGGNFNALNPSTLSDLSRYDASKYDDAQKFAKSISSDNVTTNMEAYSQATQHPEELAQMSEPVFRQFLRTNFDKGDQEKIVTLRTGYMTGANDDSPKAINNDTVNQAVNTRLKSLGIDSAATVAKDKNTAIQVANVQKFIRDDIYRQQQAIGRKLTPKEVEDHVDTLFAKSSELTHFWQPKKLMEMTYNDVPSNMADVLRKQFASRGVANPSDSDILEAYWRYKNKGKVDGGQ